MLNAILAVCVVSTIEGKYLLVQIQEGHLDEQLMMRQVVNDVGKYIFIKKKLI